LGWLHRDRRLSEDDEDFPETSEVLQPIAVIHLMARRVRTEPSQTRS
jgi:hypothetical protein